MLITLTVIIERKVPDSANGINKEKSDFDLIVFIIENVSPFILASSVQTIETDEEQIKFYIK